MNNYRKILLVILAASSVAFIFFALLRGGNYPEDIISREMDSSSGIDVNDIGVDSVSMDEPALPEAKTRASPPMPMSLPPMPERELPLIKQMDALVERAKAGDGAATCRLVIQSRRCQMSARRAKMAAEMEASLMKRDGKQRDEGLLIGMIASMESGTSASAAYCKGLDVDSMPDTETFVTGSLKFMSARQKTLLAMAAPDGSIPRLPRSMLSSSGMGSNSSYTMPQFVSDHGYRFLEQGIAAADPLALEGMMLVHSPVWIPGTDRSPRLSMPDGLKFARYTMLMNAVYGEDFTGDLARAILQRVQLSSTPEQLSMLDSQLVRDVAQWNAASKHAPHFDLSELDDADPGKTCVGD